MMATPGEWKQSPTLPRGCSDKGDTTIEEKHGGYLGYKLLFGLQLKITNYFRTLWL